MLQSSGSRGQGALKGERLFSAGGGLTLTKLALRTWFIVKLLAKSLTLMANRIEFNAEPLGTPH